MDTTARLPDEPVETCLFTTDVQDTLLTYSDASTLSRKDLLSQFLTGSLATLEPTSGIAAVIDFLTNIQDFDFDAHLFMNQVKSKTSGQKDSDLIVKKHKQ